MLEFSVGAGRLAGPVVGCPALETDGAIDYRVVLFDSRLGVGHP